MNSKEALNKLYMACDNDLLYEQSGIMFPSELTRIIEQSLNRLEKLEKENQELLVNKNVAQGIAKKFKEENDKLKKVCHILLYKKINIDFLRESKDVDEYNKWISNLMNYRELSPEQYELLKEVFENE